jgi:hypothetical protein
LKQIFAAQNFEFATVLAVTTLVTAFGTVLPNLIAPTRPYNRSRLWGEVLVSHQLTYIAFFITLFASTVELQLWYRILCGLLLSLTVLFLVLGMLNIKEHEGIVTDTAKTHPQKREEILHSNKTLTFFAAVAFLGALVLIFCLQFGKKEIK